MVNTNELPEPANWGGDDNDELYPGQKEDYRRNQIIERAVQEADRIILDGSDGSAEETDFLTAEVAFKFMEKVKHAVHAKLAKKLLDDRVSKWTR